MEAPTPRKSKRVPISFAAWLSALSTSWRSILLTMSKLLSATATPIRETRRHVRSRGYWPPGQVWWIYDAAGRRPAAGRRRSAADGQQLDRVGAEAAGPVIRMQRPGAVSAILHSARPAGRHTAGCPSGQRERSVKPSA